MLHLLKPRCIEANVTIHTWKIKLKLAIRLFVLVSCWVLAHCQRYHMMSFPVRLNTICLTQRTTDLHNKYLKFWRFLHIGLLAGLHELWLPRNRLSSSQFTQTYLSCSSLVSGQHRPIKSKPSNIYNTQCSWWIVWQIGIEVILFQLLIWWCLHPHQKNHAVNLGTLTHHPSFLDLDTKIGTTLTLPLKL